MFLHPPAKTFVHDKFRLIMTRTISPRCNNVKKVFVELLIDRRMVLNHAEEGFNFAEKVLGVTRVTGVFALDASHIFFDFFAIDPQMIPSVAVSDDLFIELCVIIY